MRLAIQPGKYYRVLRPTTMFPVDFKIDSIGERQLVAVVEVNDDDWWVVKVADIQDALKHGDIALKMRLDKRIQIGNT